MGYFFFFFVKFVSPKNCHDRLLMTKAIIGKKKNYTDKPIFPHTT